MDAMMLTIAFIAFFALIAAWLILPASPVVSTATSSVRVPRRAAARSVAQV